MTLKSFGHGAKIMGENETKQEILLNRAKLWISILAGVATLIVGGYNMKNIFFKKPEPVKAEPAKSDPIRSAVEEVGASWIKKLGSSD